MIKTLVFDPLLLVSAVKVGDCIRIAYLPPHTTILAQRQTGINMEIDIEVPDDGPGIEQ